MTMDSGVEHHLRKALEVLNEDPTSSREKSLVKTKIEEALMWIRYESNGGI